MAQQPPPPILRKLYPGDIPDLLSHLLTKERVGGHPAHLGACATQELPKRDRVDRGPMYHQFRHGRTRESIVTAVTIGQGAMLSIWPHEGLGIYQLRS